LAVQGPNDANRDGLIGFISNTVTSHCCKLGSTIQMQYRNNIDYGFDQIVPAERTGKNIFYKKAFVAVERVNLLQMKTIPKFFNEKHDHTQIIKLMQANMSPDGSNYNASGNFICSFFKNICLSKCW
jgi:hypothetical protein